MGSQVLRSTPALLVINPFKFPPLLAVPTTASRIYYSTINPSARRIAEVNGCPHPRLIDGAALHDRLTTGLRSP